MANGFGTLNRARYAGLDFDTHNDDLRARLQVKFAADFNDFAVSSLGIMLLDLTAFGLDTLSFYLDRRATDTYLATARTRKTVARLARQLGYKMGGAVASAVDVLISVDEVQAFDVTIPKGFQLEGPNGLIFEVARDTLYTPAEQGADSPKAVPCFEGETITENFVSDGTPLQVFELSQVPEDKFVVAGTVTCLVDAAAFEVVDLLEFGATDQFEVGFNDEPPTVRFGDGLAGNIPTNGASIDVTYVASRGKEGQVGIGTITASVTPLVVAFTTIPLTINNPEGSVGGDDRESLTSAKTFAPKVFKSREVAVTGGDYEALAGSYADPLFGRVAVAKAISSRSSATDLTVQNFLQDILDATSIFNTALGTNTAAITTALDLLDPEVLNVDAEAASIAAHVSTIETNANTVITTSRATKNLAGEIGVDSVDIQSFVVSGKAATDASAASAGEKTTIKGFFDSINSEALNIATDSASVLGNADATITSAQDILTEVEEVGTDTVTSGTDLNDIVNSTAIVTAQSAVVRAANLAIISADTDITSEVTLAKSGIDAHLDKVLSDDCKANLVTVPILTRDAGGFYTGPAQGLIDSLQTFLDKRKEVTQTVSVTSGVDFLIPAVVTARVGVLQNFSETVVQSAVQSAIEGVLRDRAFQDPLYESDLDDAVLALDGVDFANIRITGHLSPDGVTVLTTRLDSDGNLVIEESEVITRGTISIATEIVAI